MTYWIYDAIGHRKSPWMAPERLARLKIDLLKKQLISACKNVAYYRAAYGQCGLDPNHFKCLADLQDYPIINRDIIQQDESRFLSSTISPDKIPRSHSSGSSGKPLWTYFDRNTWFRKKYLSKLRTRLECGLRLGDRVAIFDTAPPEELAPRNRKKIFATPALYVRFFSLFEKEEVNLDGLLDWGAQAIDSPPNHLFHIAQEMRKRGIQPPTVKRIFTSSEYLEPNMKKFIEMAFGAEIFDVYGCTEIKEIAWECEQHEGYHINEDDVHVEILHNETPAPPGEVGDIVLTDLRNSAMPLIRYRIGDKGMLVPGSCSCGRSFSRMVPAAGRASEYITTPSGSKISPYRFTTAIEHIQGLLQYQFIQENLESVTVKVIMDGLTNNQYEKEIKIKIQEILGNEMAISVDKCDVIKLEANGKYKVVISKIP